MNTFLAIACDAKAMGFRMFTQTGMYWPYCVKTNNPSDVVVGRLLTFNDDKIFKQKLQKADHIEGYSENNDQSLFLREIVDIQAFDKNNYPYNDKAIMYYRKREETNEIWIKHGNWLKRKDFQITKK